MATINGVYHPTDTDTYDLTGTGAGGGDLGTLAQTAGQKAMDAAAAALAEAKEYADSRTQDTGWRDVTAGLVNGWTATSLRVRRVGPEVFYRLIELDASGATDDLFYRPPAGFRSFALAKDVYLGSRHTVILSNASGELQTPRVGFEYFSYFRCEFNHSTHNAFPAEGDYPGTPL